MAKNRCYSAFITSKNPEDHKIYKEIINSSLIDVIEEAEKFCEEHKEFDYFTEDTTDKYMDFEEEEEEDE